MLSLISTLGGLLISGLPKLLDFFQDKQDKKHELDLARMQSERELALAAQGFAAQARIEEIRTDQVAMQTDAQMTVAALEHDQKVLEKSSQWVANYVGTVRPTVTYIFVLELVLINVYLMYWGLKTPGLLTNIQDVMFFADIVFSSDEMAMLGACIGYWFGSRGWQKK
jgi:hypothetical protein